MSGTGSASKEASITVPVPADLKDAFEAAAAVADRSAADVLRDFMRAYVDRTQEPEPGYDDWFRHQVQVAIDDPRPSLPHDLVMERIRLLIDGVAAGKTRRED
jgi:hypothetical protein